MDNNRAAEAEAMLRYIELRAPEIAANIRENQIAASLNDDPTFAQLKPGTYDQYSVLDLWPAACLFVGINPLHACARKVWLEKNQQDITGDADTAVKKLFRLYELANHEGVDKDGKVRLGAFERWARQENFTPSAMFANALKTEAAPDGETSLVTDDKAQATPAPPAGQETRPMSKEAAVTSAASLLKQRVQENRIVELLVAQGHDPLALPARQPGKSGAKAEIKKLALLEPALFSKSSFVKAWDRLRGGGLVIDGE